MCDDECGSIIEDILVGFGVFFLIFGFFKLIIAAIEAFFVLLSFLFNCLLWVFYKAKRFATQGHHDSSSVTRKDELASYDGRHIYAQGIAGLVMLVGGLSLFMVNEASHVSANDAYQVKTEQVQTKPASVPIIKAKVMATKLNARLEPHSKANILYKLTHNQVVDVYMKQKGWWLVEVNGVRAWSSAKYLAAQ